MFAHNRIQDEHHPRAFMMSIIRVPTLLLATCAFLVSGCTVDETAVSPESESTPARAEGPHTAINSTIGIGVGRSSTTIYGEFYEAELRVTETRDGGPKIILENTGDGDIGYGYGYTLETRQGSAWMNKHGPVGWDVLMIMSAGDSAKPETPDLKPGWYRVTKDVLPMWDHPWPEGRAAPDFNVTAMFEVTE